MSQITRCPSCATSFKVVADQLRISDGWVRCGQCKEVFDAAAHLLPAPATTLLPDVSLTDVRPPPAPVARKADAVQAWGGTSAPSRQANSPAKAVATSPDPLYAADDFALFAPTSSAVANAETGADTGSAEAVHAESALLREPFPVRSESEPVLMVPDPAVPAFLAASGAGGWRAAENLQLEPLTPFAWRAREVATAQPAAPVPLADAAGTLPGPEGPPSVQHKPAATALDADAPVALKGMATALAPAASVRMDPAMPPLPAGYELPFADLRDDDDDPEDLLHMASFEATVPAELTPMGYPALELPIRPVTASRAAVLPPLPEPGADLDEDMAASAPAASAPGVPQRAGDEAPAKGEPVSPQGLALVEDDSPAAVLLAKPRKVAREASEDSDAEAPAQEEVSFVVAARRKAFWRKPAVRAVLVMVMLMATLALALQVAVQERDRIVAMDARARPWLVKLCAPLQCEIAPQRQIADVVIDSSSFNKARGDSYQLTLAVKSKASVALAMPAVELTLTDAQDQPVLRRVLLPADMGAPSELPSRGEWSTAVSVVVTTGGARVAGYRLLAFYP